MWKKQFAQNLRALREKAGFTQKKFSAMLNITRQTYCNYENLTREPNLNTLVSIAEMLDVSLDTLIRDTGSLNKWPHLSEERRTPMEIERKYLVKVLPENLSSYKHHKIEQGYLCTNPVVRIRREDETCYLTYKSKGMMVREEYNLPLNGEAYEHLKLKTDGILISKTRYLIPLDETLTIELDIFDHPYEGLYLAEVEFATEEEANSFVPPAWFGEDVTFSKAYHNSTLSKK